MKFDVGKHLFIQLAIFVFEYTGLYLLDTISVYHFRYTENELFLISTCIILGVFNTIYIGKYILNKYDSEAVKVLYILFSILIIAVFSVLVLPLIIIEIFLLYKAIRNPRVDNLFESDDEKRRVDQKLYQSIKQFISEKAKLRVYQIIILIIVTFLLVLLSLVITNTIVLRVLFVLLLIASYLGYKLRIETKLTKLRNDLFLPILMDQCDAEKFCFIYRILERNYGIFDIAYMYMSGLTWLDNDNQYELNHLLKKYRLFMNNILYKQIQYAKGNNTDRIDQELYETIVKYFDKILKRNNNQQIFYQMKMLEIQKLIKAENYQEILSIINILNEKGEKYPKAKEVQLNYYMGMCLYFLNRKDEGDSFLKWVINNGNTLNLVKKAKDLRESM